VSGAGAGARRPVGRQHRGLVAQLAVDGVDQDDRALLARIVGAPEHGEGQQVLVGDAEPAHHRRAQRVLGVVQRQAQFGDSQHVRGA